MMPKDQRVEFFISLAASMELEFDRLQQTGNTVPMTAEQRAASATKASQGAGKVRSKKARAKTKGRKESGYDSLH